MTTDTKSRYRDILERLEKADGPDRELDASIVAALNNVSVRRYPPPTDFGPQAKWQFWSLDGHHFIGNESRFPVEPVTNSLDAAVNLVERVVAENGRKLICFFAAGGQLMPHNAGTDDPDYHPLAKIDNSVTVGWMAHVAFYKDGGDYIGVERYSHGRTAPLSILIALFQALEAKEKQG